MTLGLQSGYRKSGLTLLYQNLKAQLGQCRISNAFFVEFSHIFSFFSCYYSYLAPEYFMHGIVDEKIDVFSFGVLLLELVTGRRALNSSQQSLLMWVSLIKP